MLASKHTDASASSVDIDTLFPYLLIASCSRLQPVCMTLSITLVPMYLHFYVLTLLQLACMLCYLSRVCHPNHLHQQYDFSLSTGDSSTGLRACIYDVRVDEHGIVYIEPPTPESTWFCKAIQPVPSEFAAIPPPPPESTTLAQLGHIHLFDPDAVKPPDPEPQTLIAWATLILNTASPLHKIAYTRYAKNAFDRGISIGGGHWDGTTWHVPANEQPPERPPRLRDEQRVEPGQQSKRGRGGSERSRIALLHALANIEQWAIDLAWDIIARGPRLSARYMQTETNQTPEMPLPRAFFADFSQVALDEAKHFTLLQQRLIEMGSFFGALPVHHGLWDSAIETAEDLCARLSIIHLVHEARGLDVNPLTIQKFRAAGDALSVESLTTIHLDEITHVSAGHRWLTYLCRVHPEHPSPVDVFRSSVRKHFVGQLKGPFNVDDRQQAGLTPQWYEGLCGEKHAERHVES